MGKLVVSHVGKAYKRYAGKWARVQEWLTGKPQHDETWVLRDIDFTINPGESVGVIGVNGAGKSTLLKIITGTTQPTKGNVHIEGRVAAILELGMGFHPDFTGRQNARIAGQLAGLTQEEIDNLIDGIEKFADIGDYFDQPVRIYSSGMQARVAFAVATASVPDVLIVDEALSVGDIAFQAKCMQRMSSLQEAGTMILFVSHALNQIRQFCSKALYLENGQIRAWGAADDVCDLFQNDLVGNHDSRRLNYIPESAPLNVSYERDPNLRKNSVDGAAGGSLELEFLNFRIVDKNNIPVLSCRRGEFLRFQATVFANENVQAGAIVGLLFADKMGYHIMACNTSYYDKYLPALSAGSVALVEWEVSVPFALGEFRIDIGIKPEVFSPNFYDRVFCAANLSIIPDVELLKRNFGGYLLSDAKIQITIE